MLSANGRCVRLVVGVIRVNGVRRDSTSSNHPGEALHYPPILQTGVNRVLYSPQVQQIFL